MAPDCAAPEGGPGGPDESAAPGQVAPARGRPADDMRTGRAAGPLAPGVGGRANGPSRSGTAEPSRTSVAARVQERTRTAAFGSLVRNTQKRKLRERSNSSTSDYFSSSAQESPEKRNKQESSSKSIVIYENPLACGLAGDNLMHQPHQAKLKSWTPGRGRSGQLEGR